MISEIFDCLAQMFKMLGIHTEHQSESEIIKTARKSSKQEDLILDMANLIRKYMNEFTPYDKFRARAYLKRIRKVN